MSSSVKGGEVLECVTPTVPRDVVLYLAVASLPRADTKLNVESHVMQSPQQHLKRSHLASVLSALLSPFFLSHIGWRGTTLLLFFYVYKYLICFLSLLLLLFAFFFSLNPGDLVWRGR